MFKFKLIIIINYIILLSFSTLFAQEVGYRDVSLQLQWKHQFQFAGYYVAKEKGFYKNYSIEVDIKEFDEIEETLDSVINDKADFGVGRSSLILEANKDIILLAAIFQSSPYILHAIKRDDIRSLDDVVGKTIMMPNNLAMMASINAMLKAKGLVQNSFKVVPHTFNINDLMNKKVDFVSSYISNEPFVLKQLGYESIIFDPKDYGFDFYDDILFTKKSLLQNDPQLVHDFYKASLQGWKYAFENIEETVNIILEKYNTQNKTKEQLLYEAKVLKELAIPNGNIEELGLIELIRLREIDNTYRLLGLKRDYSRSLKDILYNPIEIDNSKRIFTNEELNYLQEKKVITMCVDPDWLPFEKIENGKHIGMSAEYLEILEKKIGIPFQLIPTTSWSESILFAKQRKCDIYSLAMSTPERLKYMNFTRPYLSVPFVIATKIHETFVSDVESVLDKKLYGVKGYAIIELLRSQYPNINIVEVPTMHEALEAVRNGKGFGVIGSLAGLGYQIQKHYTSELKINGKFDQDWELAIGSRNDQPLFNVILDKAIQDMNPALQRQIINKWISVKVEEKMDTKTLVQIVFPILVLLIVFIIWTRKLAHEVNLRKKAQIEAQEAYMEIQNLFDSTLEAILLFKDGVCFKVNEQAVKVFGYNNKEEMIGLNIKDFVAENSIPIVLDNFKQKSVDPYQAYGLKANKEEFPMLARGQDFQGQKTQYRVSTVLDLTELKSKEELLIKQSKMVALGEMIGNIAHQWRQPLSVISLNASAIKFKKEFDQISDEEVMYLCNSINQSAQYLSQTIDDFRDFIKNDKKRSLFNVSKNIDRAVSLLEGMLNKYEVKVIVNVDEDLEIFGYDSEFTQVLLNLLNNAKDALIESAQEEKYIFIDSKKVDEMIYIYVKDNAGGISEEIISKIFEPYFTTKHQTQGTGIGLFMSYEIINKHMNGNIEAMNVNYTYKAKDYTGAQFIISVPMNNNEEE